MEPELEEEEADVGSIVLQFSVRQLHKDFMIGSDWKNSCLCKAFHYLAEMWGGEVVNELQIVGRRCSRKKSNTKQPLSKVEMLPFWNKWSFSVVFLNFPVSIKLLANRICVYVILWQYY